MYPLITDGLALVAYAATTQLHSQGSRGYAWTVVVVAAGLSGLAQATYLAGGVSVSGMLRGGVGAWPAIAAAIVAHLLFLIRSEPRAGATVERTGQPAPAEPVDNRSDHVDALATGPSVHPSVQDNAQTPVLGTPAERSTRSSSVQQSAQADDRPAVQERPSVARRPASTTGPGPRERASDAARRYASKHGRLPTVDQLRSLTDVSRGTAGNALKDLRDQPPQLHVVQDTQQASADQ